MKPVIQLVAAALAAVGAVLCWLQVKSLVDVPPVADGQPATVSVVFDAPLMMLTWLLATTTGVLLVLGVAGLLRSKV